MNIYEGVFQYLASKSLLTDLIGFPPALYPDNSQQNQQHPFVNYTVANVTRTTHLNGASQHCVYYFRFEIYSDSNQSRFDVGEALRNILHCQINVVLTDSGGNTCNLEWGELKRDVLSMKPPPDASESVTFCRMLSFNLATTESLPTHP